MADLFATKPINTILREATETGEHSLRRALGPVNLITLGIGAIIGAGIFVLTGIATARYAGPAVILSFLICSFICTLIGLCYAEFASIFPIAGSAYTYTYASLGEFIAWIIGWDLILEYSFGAATVAWGWSGYLSSFLSNFGISLPPLISGTRWDDFVLTNGQWMPTSAALASGINITGLPHTHGAVNFFGLIIVIIVSAILTRGIRESAEFNSTIVAVKVFVLLFFIAVGAHYLGNRRDLFSANWHPFMPFGWFGVLRGAAVLFFAFIGFDAISTASQEARNPSKDIPTGVLGSIGICTVLYVAFASVLLGLVSYKNLDIANPLAPGIEQTGLHWGSFVVTLGALGGLMSTIVVFLLGGSRVLYSLSNDGLLPRAFSTIHPRFRTPDKANLLLGIFVGLLTAFLPVNVLAEMVSIGTLLAFGVVCIGVWVLRVRRPDLPRAFKAPWVPLVPVVAISGILVLMFSLGWLTWLRLGAWFVIGLVLYFLYGLGHSRVQQGEIPVPVPLSPSQTPEKQLVSGILTGLFKVFVIIIGGGAVLGAVSMYFPAIDRHFRFIAPLLSLTAILVGLLYSIFPSIRSVWLLQRHELLTGEDTERIIRELIADWVKGSDARKVQK